MRKEHYNTRHHALLYLLGDLINTIDLKSIYLLRKGDNLMGLPSCPRNFHFLSSSYLSSRFFLPSWDYHCKVSRKNLDPRGHVDGLLVCCITKTLTRDALTERMVPRTIWNDCHAALRTGPPPPIPQYLDAAGRATKRSQVEGNAISTFTPPLGLNHPGSIASPTIVCWSSFVCSHRRIRYFRP